MNKLYTYYNDHEYFWNDIIKWALSHLHRAGGLHQDTFYHVLEKCNKNTAKSQIKLFARDYHGEGWE